VHCFARVLAPGKEFAFVSSHFGMQGKSSSPGSTGMDNLPSEFSSFGTSSAKERTTGKLGIEDNAKYTGYLG
jgi:hypothetical protein